MPSLAIKITKPNIIQDKVMGLLASFRVAKQQNGQDNEGIVNSSQRASFADLFNSHSCVGNDIHFSFPNMGEVEITSITRANLSLLRRARTCLLYTSPSPRDI